MSVVNVSAATRDRVHEIARREGRTPADVVDVAVSEYVEAHTQRCDICGKPGDIQYRGWHDDGDPMKTCADCGDPPA